MVHPLRMSCLFISRLANSARPLTGNFVGERLIRIGIVRIDIIAAVGIGVGSILTIRSSIWIFTRVRFGTLKNSTSENKGGSFVDLVRWEAVVIVILLGSRIRVGVWPNWRVEYVDIEIIRWIN
jgi:NADH:ubiquinone oxidoreductase subunit 4 (subunit M)